MSLTVDGYRININDRVVLSENLTQDNVRAYLQSLGFIGVGGGRFFINGVDTRTSGVDAVMNLPFTTDSAGRFDVTLTGNYNKTNVVKVPQTQQLSAPDSAAAALRPHQRAHLRGRHAADEIRGVAQLGALSLRRHVARNPLRRSARPWNDAQRSMRPRRQNSSRPRSAPEYCGQPSASPSARRICSTSIRTRFPPRVTRRATRPSPTTHPSDAPVDSSYGRMSLTF